MATVTDSAAPGLRIVVDGITKTVGDGDHVLDDVGFVIESGELVAIVGGSGAGKTTLLEAIAGIRPTDAGTITFDGIDTATHLARLRRSMGFVPQDDIIHAELPLVSTLRYAAQLRLPRETSRDEIESLVDHALDRLDLGDRRDVRVSALSGGQRKRASIAVELLTGPRVLFLDEPTSGLDPATSTGLLENLRRLADAGATVVLTTHSVQDLRWCDRVLFLARGGRLAFAGTVDAALEYFDVATVEDIYVVLADADPVVWADQWREARHPSSPTARLPRRAEAPAPEPPGFGRQLSVLSRRTADTLVRNRLTLAILIASPVMVVAMFAVLFRSGAFDFADPNPSSVVMIMFWIAFGGFFFGLTYGLLQICTEIGIVRRERLVGLRLDAYLISKLVVLAPFLLLVDLLMLGVLRLLDRLPAMGVATFASVSLTVLLDALAALALGLLTSAAVTNPSQATLALPLLCFPAVLFSGAIVPLEAMAPAGQVLSALMPDRWAFEAIGHDLGARRLFAEGGSDLGPPLLEQYGSAANRSTGFYWAILVVFLAVFLVGAWLALIRRSRPTER